MAELLMWRDKGGSFFWACCAFNSFSNRGFASVSGLAKQRQSPLGIPGTGLMILIDQWITIPPNPNPVSELTAARLDSGEAMNTFWGMGGRM